MLPTVSTLLLAFTSPDSVLTRRGVLVGAAACVAATPCAPSHASYAMGVAAQQAQSWNPTGAAAEKAVYNNLEMKLDMKRRGTADLDSLYTNEHTSYRRGDARLDWEKNRQDKGSTNGNSYMRAEEAVAVTAARRFATP